MLFRGLSEARFDVLDINGNLCLQVGGSCENFQKKRIVRDPAGFHMLTTCEKALTARHRWRRKLLACNDPINFRCQKGLISSWLTSSMEISATSRWWAVTPLSPVKYTVAML
ncbi:hypothetical protein OIU77_012402 [Salix suchowensis]|uniref:Uncharacterized protein n=1 Tax=Salix suchowensis TaxID=1278906 RepID=A0ABQ9A4M4_9ROSI|nr:hypothetical protein OIU77_012402 [Salix suchowensis]